MFRSRGRAGPAWVAAGYLLAVIPADFVTSARCFAASSHGRNGPARTADGPCRGMAGRRHRRCAISRARLG
jgi:hypothetical protein